MARILFGLLLLVSGKSVHSEFSVRNGEHKKCNSSNEEFYYWKVLNHPREVFLFGTIHTPYLKVWPRLPAFLERQIARSDVVYFELDLMNGDVKRKLLECQLLPNGGHLKDHLPEPLYRKLKTFFRAKRNEVEDKLIYDLLIRSWRFKKLIWILFLLNFLIENDSRFYRIPAIDNLINLRAKQLHKTVRSIETVEDQCRPLNSLSAEQVIKFLNQTLEAFDETGRLIHKIDSLSRQRNSVDLLIEQYKCGKLNSSLHSFLGQDRHLLSDWNARNGNSSRSRNSSSLGDEIGSRIGSNSISRDKHADDKQIESINDFFQRQLIEQRNEKITETISEQLKRNADKNMLFVIGSAHFLGSGLNSVLKGLELKHGYQIEKVNTRKIASLMRSATSQNPSNSDWWRRAPQPVQGFERSSAYNHHNYLGQPIGHPNIDRATVGYPASHTRNRFIGSQSNGITNGITNGLSGSLLDGFASSSALTGNQTVYANLINSRLESIRNYNNFWLYFKLLN